MERAVRDAPVPNLRRENVGEIMKLISLKAFDCVGTIQGQRLFEEIQYF